MAFFRRSPRTLPAGDATADGWRHRWVGGEREVIERVYRDTFEAVQRAAGRVLREPADRDAIVQSVFADLVGDRALRASWAGGDLSAWVAAIARHRALDFARRESRLCALDDAPEGRDGGVDHAAERLRDFRSDLERFAATLDGPRRDLLRLRFMEGLTQMEAAERLDVPRSTLEDWERQMKAQLRKHLLDPAEPTLAARPGASATGGER